MASTDTKGVMLVKALLSARDILLEELLRLSKAISQPLDLTDFISKMDDMKWSDSVSLRDTSPRYGKLHDGFEVQD